MNKRLGVVLLFAAIISAAASFMLYRLLAGQARAGKPAAGVSVIVAAKPLKLGATIRESDIKTVEWQGPVPPQANLKKEDAVGRGVVSEILEGEPIMETRLAAKGAGGGLAATIPPGMRAVAIRVNDVVSVAGFVLPGTRVDVLMSADAPKSMDASTGRLTRTILQNIEVLSAGKELERDAEGKPVNVPVLNLLVTPGQAEILSLATNEARIQLVLRNPMDTDVAKTAGAQMAHLLFPETEPRPRPVPAPQRPAPKAQPAAKQPEIPAPFTVEIIHGVKKKDSSFPPSGGLKP